MARTKSTLVRLPNLSAKMKDADRQFQDHQNYVQQLRAKLEAAERQTEEYQRCWEDCQKESNMERRQKLEDLIDDILLDELQAKVNADQNVQSALKSMANGHGTKEDFQQLDAFLMGAICKNDGDYYKVLAIKILGHSVNSDSSAALETTLTQDPSAPAEKDNNEASTPSREMTSGQDIADMNSTDGINNSSEVPTTVAVKDEGSFFLNSPSAEQLKLTEFDDRTPMRMQYSNLNSGPMASPSLSVTVPPHSTESDGQVSTSPVLRSGGRESVRSDVGSKRSREESTCSQVSSTPLTKPKKQARLSPTAQSFVQRLDDAVSTGGSALEELVCQRCGKQPSDPKLSACIHLYCGTCVSTIRKAANKAEATPKCVKCSEDLGKMVRSVDKNQFDEWVETYEKQSGADDVEEDDTNEETAFDVAETDKMDEA